APSCCSAKPSDSETTRSNHDPHLGPHHRIQTPGRQPAHRAHQQSSVGFPASRLVAGQPAPQLFARVTGAAEVAGRPNASGRASIALHVMLNGRRPHGPRTRPSPAPTPPGPGPVSGTCPSSARRGPRLSRGRVVVLACAWGRSTRISTSFEVSDRASSAIQPNTRKTIKYSSRRAMLRSCRSRAAAHGKTPDQTLRHDSRHSNPPDQIGRPGRFGVRRGRTCRGGDACQPGPDRPGMAALAGTAD
ncbi:MAG: hypothetical protein QOE54_39, partial [Streptosporangiaceae bacterium]|nr:hypothetical protein [Streptosporangiaceae bacterium]